MDPLILLCIASATFLATHFASSTPLRAALAGVLGERGYSALYSLVAFATLGWMIWAYNRAPLEALWPGLRLAPAILMPFSFMLLVGGLLTRNPSAVGQAKALKAEEPARAVLRVTPPFFDVHRAVNLLIIDPLFAGVVNVTIAGPVRVVVGAGCAAAEPGDAGTPTSTGNDASEAGPVPAALIAATLNV